MITKHFYSILGALCLLCALCVSCSQDDGNYDYLPDSEVSKIELVVDSTRTLNPYAIYSMSAGDEIEYFLKVTYPHPERLRYSWFVLKSYYNSYRAEQIGNAMVYSGGHRE